MLALGFASGMRAGRLISSRLLLKYSAVSVSFLCSGLMVITTYCTLHAGNPAIAGLSIFCAVAVMGPVFPSISAVVRDAFSQMTATCIELVITARWIGAVVRS